MKRIFIAQSDISQETVIFSGDNFHYLKNVLRVVEGEKIETVMTDERLRHIVVISRLEKKKIYATIFDTINTQEPQLTISIVQAIPKAQKMELILQKCTELGVVNFYPLISQRIVPDIQAKKDRKIVRWQSICMEAAKQCRRYDIPTVFDPVAILDLPKIYARHALNILLWENETRQNFKQVLLAHKPQTVSVTIGPEGGFTEEEIASLSRASAIPVTLGPTTLRTETASIVACSMLNYEYLLSP